MEEPSSDADEAVKSIENDKVASILKQVSQLSELDKYMLYLQLPTEETADDGIDDTSKVPQTLMAKRIDAAVKWIRQNYTDTHDQSVFLPKEEFYEHYREECEVEYSKPLSIADFGKVIKLVFPKIAQRRLGQRGKSRYGYEGLKKKEGSTISTCTACNRDLSEKPSPDVHLYTLSCQIVCEWASQLLDRQLSDIKSLSEYLVSKGFSYGKSAAKFSLLSGSSGHHKQLEKDRKSPRFQDGQVLLQRKLLQKEIIRQHKQKLQEQQKFQREIAKTLPLNLAHRGGRKQRNQPRPSSVQSYTPSWSSNQINSSYGFLASGQVLPLTEAHSNATQASSRLMGILLSGGKDSSTPMKRCQSASVVEKYSDSSNVLDLFHEGDAICKQKLLSTQNPAFSSPSITSDSTDTIMSSPAITRGNSRAGNSRLETLLAQHYKRNGDSISPDGESKRRCMTSLGVREQENLNPIHLSDDSELIRLRPYSCPVICSDQGQVKSASQEKVKKCKTSDGVIKSEAWPVKLRCDKSDTKRGTQENNKIHFVQKPTVINGRINNLHNVVSCPDFQQLAKDVEMPLGDVMHSRPSSNILNSLLSTDLDLLWRKSDDLNADKLTASRPHSLASSVSDLSTLTNHQLRVITDPSHSSESAVKLSNQSSRSAFVPVTSHKQSHVSSSMQQETKFPQHFPPITLIKDPDPSLFQSSKQSCKSSTDSSTTSYVDKIFLDHLDHQFYSNGSIFPHIVSPSENASTQETSGQANLFNQDASTLPLASDTESQQKQQIPDTVLYMSQASCQPHLVVVSANSTTTCSTSPVTRISTSTVASPVVSTSSPVSTMHTAFVMTPPPRNVGSMTSVISSNISSVTNSIVSTCVVSSTSCSSSTPQTSTSNSSTITPPRRASKNRFTPIRPKLGGSRSPQFSTTPSPTKKDMRPVSAILKEQRGFKIANGLLVNLGNNYQGEVKFQMPAEILCLAPGKSKTSDLLVTINPPSSIPSSKSYSLTTDSSPILWPLTIPTQQAKSSDSLTSPGLNQSAYSVLAQPNVEASSVQLATDLNPSTPDLPITLCSPNITLHRNTSSTASLCVNKQLIILSPSKSVKSGDRSADRIPCVGDHHELYKQTMSTNCQIDQKVDSVTMHGLDRVNEKRSIESPHTHEESFPLPFNTNVFKMEESLTTSSRGQAQFKCDKDVRPSVQFSKDNLMLNQKIMLHQKLYDQAMSTNGQCIDQKVDLILHGLDTANEKRSLGSPPLTGQSFSVTSHGNSSKTEEVLTTCSATNQSELKADKEVRPSAQSCRDENFDKLMLSQKTMSVSSTLLSELSQLVNSGHQPFIQHSSSPSAFYKCSNQQLKPSDNLVKNVLNQAIFKSDSDTNSVIFPLQTVENSSGQASQIARKRKVGGEEHGNNKKINRSMKKELDDDVFIINIEDSVSLPNGNVNAGDGTQSEKLGDKSSVDGRTSDTDKLLGMLPNKEGLTVKETVKALNDLRAKMVSGTQNMGRATHIKADLGTCKTAFNMSTLGDLQSCSSEDSLFKSDKVSPGSDVCESHGRERKNVSLNVESLESDALLDLDQAWSLNLVSEMADGIKEQKTSVGVAAKSASKTIKHIVSRQVLDPKSHSNAIITSSVGKTQPCSVSPKTESTSSTSSKPKVASRKKTLINVDKGRTQLHQIDSINKQSTTQEPIRRSSMTNIELKSSNAQHAGASNGKASNHPTLAQCLAVSTADKCVAPVRSLSLSSEMESEHELPGEIIDFITGYTCYRRQTSDVSFCSDLYNNTDKFEQSSTLLRSFSAPNTLALAHQASHSARVNDIKVSLADHESNLYDLDCDTSGANPHRSSQSQSSGIFLSPVGTAKMNRRLSMERSVASESNLTKNSGDSKANGERPPSRLKGGVEKCKMPVDRLVSKLLTDKTSRTVWGRGSGTNGKEEAYAEVQQGHVSNVKRYPDKDLLGGFSCSTNTETSKPDTDRSTNYTPLSDGGYGSITQTPVSDAGSISPSPVMITSANYLGEAERRDILSPATIFMPLRSENSSRNAADNCFTGRVNRTASDVNNYSKFVHFLDPSKLTSKNVVQTVLDLAGAHKFGKGVNSTSLQDLTTQIHCIPTPPSSPSNSHNNEASLNASSESKNGHFGQACVTSSVAKDNQCANVETNTSLQSKFTSSPKMSSPKIAPVTSPLPQGHSRTQMYNPHPSPPFTPSSQQCLASPRCPTPCQLTSSGCTTPISDSNGAPNRFVPIQTSGILGNSAVGYIQPIRPVVTNVANMHSKSLLTSQMKAKPQEMPNFLNPEPEQHMTSNTNTSQKKDHHNGERHVTVPPALVLSLTGGIGSVSGRGMKDGWGGHEMSQATAGYPSQVVVKQELDQSDTMPSSMHLSNDMLPTYEEAISLLVGSQNNFNNAAPQVSKKAGSSDPLSEHILPVSTQQTDSSKSNYQSAQGNSHIPQQSGQKENCDNAKMLTMETFLNMVAKNEKMQLSHQSPMSHSVVTNKKQTSDSSLRQLLSSKTSSLSTMLQAPAFSTVYPKPVPLEAFSKVQIASDSSKSPKEINRRKSSSSLNELFTTKWSSAEVGDSFQISELPSACYSGTTPNKTAPDVSSYGSLSTFLDQQPQHLMGMNFSSEMEHLRQDDLDETLDVLKNIDSQYFQADEDEMV